jgi:alpha-L-arabinofuranosidase
VAAAPPAAGAARAPEIRVDARSVEHQTSPFVTGVNHMFGLAGRPPGNWDVAGNRPAQRVVELTRRAGVKLIRFPGGTQANLYNWTRGIGGPGARPPCQQNGAQGKGPLSNVYGFDEHMRFVAAAGAEAQVMVPFASQMPAKAADWVEYANDPAGGANPNGGEAWADVRAANGHPESYGIKRWEIGNEPDRRGQRYWLAADTDRARAQYASGDLYRVRRQAADRDCRWAAPSNGQPGQVYTIRYAPAVPRTVVVRVAGERWRRVPNVDAAAPGAKVFQLDLATGNIRFGGGAHGAVPPAGRRILVSYHAQRPGFADYRDAMKAVDPSIDVCATWADREFVELMRGRGGFDCLAVHPYTDLSEFGKRLHGPEMHRAHMVGSREQANAMSRLAALLRQDPGPRKPYLVTTEYGALGHDARIGPKGWQRSLSHALYMGSQMATWMRLGLPWAEGGRLTDLAFGIVGARERVLTPAGQMTQLFGDMPGQPLLRHRLRRMPDPRGYPALKVEATRDAAGRVNLLVLNRSPRRAVRARLTFAGTSRGPAATVWRLTAPRFSSPAAKLRSHAAKRLPRRFTFPPHSGVRIRLE